jgi:hypothetical protein
VVATLLVLVAVTAVGCDSDLAPAVRKSGPALVTRAQLERYPAGAPARQVLEWWRALQFLDPALARGYYARGSRPSEAQLASELSIGAEALGTALRPQIADVQRRRFERTVFVVLTKRKRTPNGRVDLEHSPYAFTLVLEDGRWKLADNRLLDRAAERASTRGGE